MPLHTEAQAPTLTPNTWGGHPINDGTVYIAIMSDKSVDNGGSVPSRAVLGNIPDRYPRYIRQQPSDKTYLLSITLPPPLTQAHIDTLKQWFDPAYGQQLLVFTDHTGNVRQILGFPESFVPRQTQGNSWAITLRCATPVSEANTATSANQQITASGQTATLTNGGSHRAYPTFTVTPQSLMSTANSWIRRSRILVANRSELPLTDPVGDGYPMNLVGAGLNTVTLNGASKIRSDLYDGRVVLEGAEINRWFYPLAATNAASLLWVNLQMRARKTATLAANVNSSALVFTVNNPEGTTGWPASGFILIDNECVQYSSLTPTSFIISHRGARNTAAASHTANTGFYWMEHPFLDFIYSYSAAANPSPPDDRKPAFDASASTNAVWKWTSGLFLNASDRKSAAWQLISTDDGPSTAFVVVYQSGNYLIFEDNIPVGTKPNFNNIYLDQPVGMLSLQYDAGINPLWGLDLWFTDIAGNEFLDVQNVGDLTYHLPATTLTTIAPAAPGLTVFRARIHGRPAVIAGPNWLSLSTANIGIGLVPGVSSSSMSFINDSAEANIQAIFGRFLVSAGNTRDLTCAIYSDLNGTPGVSLQFVGGVTVSHTIMATGYNVLKFDFSSMPIRLEAGQRYHVTFALGGGAGTVVLAGNGFRSKGRIYGVVAGNADFTQDAHVWIVSDYHVQPQVDAPTATGHQIYLNNLLANLDTTRTPLIVYGSEESVYLANFTIKNQTTGDNISVYFPMTLNQSVVIDCQNKLITDSETGVPIPFALTASNPQEWISLSPGANVIEYDEVGVVSTNLAWTFRSRWL